MVLVYPCHPAYASSLPGHVTCSCECSSPKFARMAKRRARYAQLNSDPVGQVRFSWASVVVTGGEVACLIFQEIF